MATAREQVAAQIKADNPTFAVDNYPNEPQQVTNKKPYVDVFTTRIAPEGGETLLRHDIEVHVYVAQRGTEAAERQLEDARDDVLLSLQRIEHYQWEQAERSIFLEQYAGYKITGWVTSQNVYRQTVTTEGVTP